MNSITDSAMMRALAAAIRSNTPVFLLGNPGQAKSATLAALADAWGWHLETVIGSNRDRTDFLGTMIEVDGEVNYSTLGWARRANDAKHAIVFLDELTTTSADVQKAMLRVIQERYVGDTRLGEHVVLIAAGNPPANAADGYDLEAPVANRFMHLDWAFPVEQWAEGMLTGFDALTYPSLTAMIGAGDQDWAARIRSLLVTFVTQVQPQLLTPTPPEDPTQAGRAWASPRSWSMAADVLAELAADDLAAQSLVLDGTVGKAARIAFQQWVSNLDLPTPEDMLDDPQRVAWSSLRPDQLFAALTGLQAWLAQRTIDGDLWAEAVEVCVAVARHQRPDVGISLATWLLSHRPSRRTKIPAALRDAYMELFTTMGSFAAAA